MKVEKVTMPKAKAKRYWKEYCVTLKSRQKDYIKEIKELKSCYYQLSKGRAILDIVEVFKKSGYNEKNQPKFAIAPAKEKEIRFYQYENSTNGHFTSLNNWNPTYFVSLPDGTFQNVKRARLQLKTKVPLIPPKFLPRTLRNCYILWEVESWENVPPKDPILLKKITGNLYAVLATWNLTKLERLIVGGR